MFGNTLSRWLAASTCRNTMCVVSVTDSTRDTVMSPHVGLGLCSCRWLLAHDLLQATDVECSLSFSELDVLQNGMFSFLLISQYS
jgi:hypothetical protein